jgi:hypothetical protein
VCVAAKEERWCVLRVELDGLIEVLDGLLELALGRELTAAFDETASVLRLIRLP